jgi:hypothetical protein
MPKELFSAPEDAAIGGADRLVPERFSNLGHAVPAQEKREDPPAIIAGHAERLRDRVGEIESLGLAD